MPVVLLFLALSTAFSIMKKVISVKKDVSVEVKIKDKQKYYFSLCCVPNLSSVEA